MSTFPNPGHLVDISRVGKSQAKTKTWLVKWRVQARKREKYVIYVYEIYVLTYLK